MTAAAAAIAINLMGPPSRDDAVRSRLMVKLDMQNSSSRCTDEKWTDSMIEL
jgi:hypothetical protein